MDKYLGVVTTNLVIGTNFFSDFTASLSDFFGGMSGTYQKQMDTLYKRANEEISRKATERGANCILGFKIDFDEISGKDKSMLMVSVSGTACVVDYDSKGGAQRIEQVGRLAVDEELEKMREQERERLEREDSLAELEVLRHVEELQRDAEGRSATSPASSAVSEDDFF